MQEAIKAYNAKHDPDVHINPVPRRSYSHAGRFDPLKGWDVTIFNNTKPEEKDLTVFAATKATELWKFFKEEHKVVTLPGYMTMLSLDAGEDLARNVVFLEVSHSGVLFALMLKERLCIADRVFY
jgi:hypothetical protein